MKNNIISPSCLYVHAQKFVLFLFSLIFKKSKRSSRMLFFEFKFKFFQKQIPITNNKLTVYCTIRCYETCIMSLSSQL